MYSDKEESEARIKIHQNHKAIFSAMDEDRWSWYGHWQELSTYFLPRRYPTLGGLGKNKANRRNTKLLDSTSTKALRTLASGMMNGVTSPSRKWFGLKIEGRTAEELTQEDRVWLEDTAKRMRIVLAQSNFYTSIALHYLEWCCFGTASTTIEEDFDDVIRCINHPLGEFYISQDGTQRINRHCRRFELTVEQTVNKFGIENVSHTVRDAYERKGSALFRMVEVIHLIEPNEDDELSNFSSDYREVFWESGAGMGKYLSIRPVFEWKAITTRWEIMGNDSWGTSPCMDALSETISLQTLILERAQAVGKTNRPPLIVDQQLRNRPKALGEGGITYASTASSNFGAKPAYQINAPFQEMSLDIRNYQTAIRETLHNPLFNMISQLETVRSATEIDARREEKLIHLGPVLERFYNEGLDPILKRVYGIMLRNGALADAPESLADAPIEVEYVSILVEAQRASGTVTTERFLSFAGELSGVYPEVRNIPNVEALIRAYADDLGVDPRGINSQEDVAEAREAENASEQLAATAAVGKDLAQGAKVLSETDVGGGLNALQQIM